MTTPVPETTSLARLADAAARCEACELYEHADQTVFGSGRKKSSVVLVGEQPGDVEDREGVPFVGPAGRVLDSALAAAGLQRNEVYLTNAVKHFRWKAGTRGTRRLHQRPATSHIVACRPWLAAELRAIGPRIVVALGAVAGEALFGRSFRLTQLRGQPLPWPPDDGPFADDNSGIEVAYATLHPSAVLRGRDADRRELLAGLVADLATVGKRLSDR